MEGEWHPSFGAVEPCYRRATPIGEPARAWRGAAQLIADPSAGPVPLMPHLISFETAKFDPRREPRNPINPIGGHSVLEWLRVAVASHVTLTEPDTEDWGWYSTADLDGRGYLVGASSYGSQDDAPPLEWIIQIHKNRGLLEKVLGRNRMAPDDPLSAIIFAAVRNQADFTKVELDVEG